MTSVTFETATIADVLRKAEACAPSRTRANDHAFGTASGIMIELHPAGRDGDGTPEARVRSTNLEVFYDEWVDVVEMDAQPGQAWRVVAHVVTGIVASLPIGTGRQVTMTQDGGMLKLASGGTTAKLHLLDADSYPEWEPYSEEYSAVVSHLGERISQVSWACDDKEDPFTGVYFDGTHAVATNRHRAAVVPCEIPILDGKAVTVPAKVLGPIIRHSGDVRVGRTANHITISPDEHTQIRAVVFDKNIPSPSAFMKIPYNASAVVSRDLLIDTIRRMLNVTKGSKDIPVVKMLIGGGRLTLRVENADGGEYVEDVIELDGQGQHLPVLLQFYPATFTEAVGKAPDEKIALRYNAGPEARNEIVSVDGGGDYRSWFVQWKGKTGGEGQ